MSSIVEISHKSNPGERVVLFRLDATKLGGTVQYFCQGRLGESDVSFGGINYRPIDIEFSDFEINAGGVLPRPQIRVANSDNYIQDLVNEFGDLAGAEIRRVRTFKRFLDGQPDEDPSAFVGPDVFRIERKSEENPIYIEWELSAAIDQEGKMIPGGQVLRDACRFRYRYYDPTHPDAAGDGFVYPTINPCPYTGAGSFNAQNEATTSELDDCSYMLSGCRLRFPSQPLPFGGFPGSSRVR